MCAPRKKDYSSRFMYTLSIKRVLLTFIRLLAPLFCSSISSFSSTLLSLLFRSFFFF